ncbi:Bro-N domain-containing protein [Acetobacter persici]|uniref:BRO-N domain-containing protein n=1 Tax=Acetobacter persici TaxID=1076596 RepID=UPI001BA93AE0|nr:Bro-N domain-containing protein [Acetobacter persici]MBS0962644.1 Bro-N domain-containing protein [Acetobacter persici]MCG0996815.1 Bro-N domain-containing protein [Acetobacter persici]
MSTVIPFSFEEHAVRVLTREGEPWFVLADVCDVLEIGNPTMAARRLDNDEKGVNTIETLGGQQDASIINESGLYTLILTSRKAEAKRFRKWVTAEVLPSIRKTGSYALPTSKAEWFSRFARVLCLWDAVGEAAAYQEWQNCGLPFPMPRKQGVRILMEATLDMPVLDPGPDRPPSTAKIIASRHNGALGGRPRKGETPIEARRRKLHMVDSEVIPAPDGQNATVITYATHPEQQERFSGV